MRLMAALVVAALAGCVPQQLAGSESSRPVAESTVVFEGDGGGSSDPQRLDAGDYRMRWVTYDDCYYGFDLEPLDGQSGWVDLPPVGEPSGSGNVYGVDGGRWYLEVFTGPAPGCRWWVMFEPR